MTRVPLHLFGGHRCQWSERPEPKDQPNRPARSSFIAAHRPLGLENPRV